MATQFFRVVAKDGLRVRTKPEISASTLIRDHKLVYGDILEVKTESRTEAANYVWWEHANNPGMWTASQQIAPLVTMMENYQPPHDPTPPPVTTPTGTTSGGTSTGTTTPPSGGTTSGGTSSSGGTTTSTPAPQTVTFEVIADSLSIRSQPKLGNTLVNGQSLKRGQRLQFKNPSTKADGFIWWEQVAHPGWWSASGSMQGGQSFMNPVDDVVVTEDNTHLLTVPWVTQIQTSGINFKNDCGHTSTLMVMRYSGLGWNMSVGDLYKLPYKTASGTTVKEQLVQIARDASGGKLTLTPFAINPANLNSMQSLRDSIKNNKPVILLVWYPSLKFHNPSNGAFSHWIVVTGYKGDTFYINDPLWLTENQGAGRTIDSTTLLKACQDTNEGLYGVS
jgi:uncharacterized protein YvpB